MLFRWLRHWFDTPLLSYAWLQYLINKFSLSFLFTASLYDYNRWLSRHLRCCHWSLPRAAIFIDNTFTALNDWYASSSFRFTVIWILNNIEYSHWLPMGWPLVARCTNTSQEMARPPHPPQECIVVTQWNEWMDARENERGRWSNVGGIINPRPSLYLWSRWLREWEWNESLHCKWCRNGRTWLHHEIPSKWGRNTSCNERKSRECRNECKRWKFRHRIPRNLWCESESNGEEISKRKLAFV